MVRIVVGYDVSPAAGAVLGWVPDQAKRTDAEVELVTVTHMVLGDEDVTDDMLDAAVEELSERGVDGVAQVLGREVVAPVGGVDEAEPAPVPSGRPVPPVRSRAPSC